MAAMPALRKWRQYQKFKVSLGYMRCSAYENKTMWAFPFLPPGHQPWGFSALTAHKRHQPLLMSHGPPSV